MGQSTLRNRKIVHIFLKFITDDVTSQKLDKVIQQIKDLSCPTMEQHLKSREI